MSNASTIVHHLHAAGISLVASVPDKWISDVMDAVVAHPEMTLVRCTREDDGVGLCAGAFLGGRKAALLCQNAGLLLSANALAGYGQHHQIPMLVLAALRGSHDDGYYYQTYKGRVTAPVLDAVGVPYHHVTGPDHFELIGEAAFQAYLSRRPVALLFSRRALLGPDSRP
ncbi:MAG: thiamine pyrophosphate-binding protein [Chloroflexota bacterium]